MDFVMDNFPPDRVVFGVDYPLCEGAEPGVHAKCTRPNRFCCGSLVATAGNAFVEECSVVAAAARVRSSSLLSVL